MTVPNPDAYTPTTPESARLRQANAVPMAGDENGADYPLPRLSAERCIPTPSARTGIPATYATRWHSSRVAVRQIDRLTDEVEQPRRQPHHQKRSGGVLLPPLPGDTDMDWF